MGTMEQIARDIREGAFPNKSEATLREEQYRARIVEVLAKYNVKLPDAPLDALAMAMERMAVNQ